MTVLNAYVIKQNETPMGFLEYFRLKEKKISKGIDSMSLVCNDYTARHNEEIVVYTGDRVITITLPKIEGELTEPIMYEVEKDDAGSGKIIIVDEAGLMLGNSKTYEITKHKQSIRFITRGDDYILF